MRETAPAVRSQNSAFRDLLPFYSIGHVSFALVLVTGIYLMMMRLDPPTAPFVALGSLIGMAAVGSMSKPAWILVAPNQVGHLERLLVKQGWKQTPSGEWLPSLPKWLRWSYNRVGIGKEDGAVLVTGPAIVLRGLAAELNRQP